MDDELYDRNRLKNRLTELSEEKYKKFNESIVPGIGRKSYGVKVPTLRNIAKEIIKGDWRNFLSLYNDDEIYEIKMLSAMVIALSKCEFSEKLDRTARFIPRIDNWALCDIFCGDLKDVSKNLEQTYEFLQTYFKSEREFDLRFAVVTLIDYFLTDEYIDKVFYRLQNVKSDLRYVKTALAWALSVCFVKYRNKTLNFMESCDMDTWTYNKAIQKAIESYRVSDDDKRILKTMKRRV